MWGFVFRKGQENPKALEMGAGGLGAPPQKAPL